MFCLRKIWFLFFWHSLYIVAYTQKLKPPITVVLDNFVTDSVPFFPVMNFIREEKDTVICISSMIDSAELKSIKINNIFEGKVVFIQGLKEMKPAFIFDRNNDGFFCDEEIYRNDQDSFFVELRHRKLRLLNTSHIMSFLVKPAPAPIFAKIKGSVSKRINHFGILIRPIYRFGIFKQDLKLVWRLALFNNFESEYTSQNSFLIITDESFPAPATFPVQYRVGDTLYLDRKIYLFEGVAPDGGKLTLKPLGVLPKKFGISEGKFSFNMLITDVRSSHTKPYIIGKSGKITLLDFWGTWCLPCIELTNDLKELQKKYESKNFEIVGIAYDKKKQDVENYIQKNSITWRNTWDDLKKPIISKKFLVNDYPTFILLDKSGRIIFRGVGREALKKIELLLKDI